MVSRMGQLLCCVAVRQVFFFFNDTATTEIYTLSLHDALPISMAYDSQFRLVPNGPEGAAGTNVKLNRSEEHTSELQSQSNLVCRLLLEKKNYHTPQQLDLKENKHAATTCTETTLLLSRRRTCA